MRLLFVTWLPIDDRQSRGTISAVPPIDRNGEAEERDETMASWLIMIFTFFMIGVGVFAIVGSDSLF